MAGKARIIGVMTTPYRKAEELAAKRGTGPKIGKNWGRLRNESQGNGKARIVRVRPNPEKMAKEIAERRGTSPPKDNVTTQKKKKK